MIRALALVQVVHSDQQLQHSCFFVKLLSVDLRCQQLVYSGQQPPLLIVVQKKPVLKTAIPNRKAMVKICLFGGERSDIFRVEVDDDPLRIDAGRADQFMAFIGVDHKKIPRMDGIYPVADQKLQIPGEGKIHFITIVDMHIQSSVFFPLADNGKGLGFQTGFNCLGAGGEDFHSTPHLAFSFSIPQLFKICKIFERIRKDMEYVCLYNELVQRDTASIKAFTERGMLMNR